jgi:fido (protein-threonine AMPylation protein)
MMMKLVYESGQTPLPADYKEDLIPSGITVMSELNEYEAKNISQAVQKYLADGRKVNLCDQADLRKIHRDMFSDVWKWAGVYRQREVGPIGCDSAQISTRLKLALQTKINLVEDRMETLINYAFRLAFALAAAGMLVPATKYMAREAAKAYQHDFISLGQLNRTLNSVPEKPNHNKR